MSAEIPHDKLVAFLSNPDTYGAGLTRVDVKETHMSWIFLTAAYVYKLKKPVRFSMLDFTTLEAREHFCREEIRLNRRLAPTIYLSAVPVTCQQNGSLALSGDGQPIDWLVKMRRLPQDRMLDRIITQNQVTDEQIDNLAALLSRFFAGTPRADISHTAYVNRFVQSHEENIPILRDPRFDLHRDKVDIILQRLEHILKTGTAWLEQPVREGRVLDGHGDLRPEHICLTAPPVIIDCLEFSPLLRAVDPLDELCFLTLECDLLGAGWVGDKITAQIAKRCAFDLTPPLLAFYTTHKACVRARLSLAHLLDPVPREPAKWEPHARQYLEIAWRASIDLPTPTKP